MNVAGTKSSVLFHAEQFHIRGVETTGRCWRTERGELCYFCERNGIEWDTPSARLSGDEKEGSIFDDNNSFESSEDESSGCEGLATGELDILLEGVPSDIMGVPDAPGSENGPSSFADFDFNWSQYGGHSDSRF